MDDLIRSLVELALSAGIILLFYRAAWRGYGRGARVAAVICCFCAFFTALSAGRAFGQTRMVTVTALKSKAPQAENTQIYLKDIVLNGTSRGIPNPIEGQWTWNNGQYCWFEEGDERRVEGETESVAFELPVTRETELVFSGNKWKGIASVQVDGKEQTVDTFSDSEDGMPVPVQLPAPSRSQITKAVLLPLFGFVLCFAALCTASTGAIALGRKISAALVTCQSERGLMNKLLKYQFLFEELVARDFKKKYKRTVLGMAWSVLSPLLTLLVMRIVFTRFFGRSMSHYTTYLFCGNLVFSYFNEATSQGMTSLTGNADIFTKVNVPKYLFLFSKNIQTLINFGLTLCVFFVFCVIDRITFTWRFVLLLYPICCLVLFNVGAGLVLSALFVFFRDIQYLWSVFTQLLMYLSAIFYTIDNYSYTAQCLFLLNPIYLFIRYFRKIVIEATIPTVWFHLLMMGDVVIALGLGCWMYKKYNTRFLYYV